MSLCRSKKIMKAASGRECQLRLYGVCNYNSETVVACHVGRNRGMGIKCSDNMVVFACYNCHQKIDSESKAKNADDILRALESTQQILIDEEIMVIK